MNKKQLVVMWLGIALFVWRGLGEGGHDRWIDYGPLIPQWVSIVVVTVGLIYTLKGKQKKDD